MVAEKPLPPVGVINQVRLTAPGNPVLVPPVAASAPPLMMPANGIVTVNELVVVRSLVSVKVPLTVMLLPSVTLPPVLLMVRLLKAVVFVRVCAPVPSKTTVLLITCRPSPGGTDGLAPSPLEI